MSILKTVGKVGKGILGLLAPTIAGALPGPMGSLAKKAVTDLLGLDPGTGEEEIEKQLATVNPEVLVKLREIDAQFKQQMAQLEVDLEKIASEDRSSARSRQIALKDRSTPVLAWTIVVSWIGCTAALFGVVPPTANKELLNIMFGILTAAMTQVVGYFFGSSAGSARKTEIMGNGK